MDETMLVNEYAQKVISERQYKYQTRQSYVTGLLPICLALYFERCQVTVSLLMMGKFKGIVAAIKNSFGYSKHL
jgi:hypothetical protein